MTENETRLERLIRRNERLTRRRDHWKNLAAQRQEEIDFLTETLTGAIILPGRHLWPPTVERWRSLVNTYLEHYGGPNYTGDADRVLDTMLGIMRYESWSKRCPLGGDPRAISTVEWVGAPPPGYDPADPSTRASGLFQIPPAYWAARSKAAGYEGCSIFDADANAAVACYMLYATWPEDRPAPHWHHWSGAHVGVRGSYEKTLEALAKVVYP